jgi:hypothetical protein
MHRDHPGSRRPNCQARIANDHDVRLPARRNALRSFLVEQLAYFDVDAAGRICYMRVICSGYRSTAERS